MKKTKLPVSKYTFGEDDFYSRPYVFVPSAAMQATTFNAAEIFKCIGLSVPNIILRLPKIGDPYKWNSKLPPHKAFLEGIGSKSAHQGTIDHFHGVVLENCKRLLSSTALACKQAGSMFRISPKWNPDCPEDHTGKWLRASNKVVILGYGCEEDYSEEVWKKLKESATTEFEENALLSGTNDDNDCDLDISGFDPEDPDLLEDPRTYPHPEITHLILTDNLPLLEEKMAQLIPWGLLLINGDEFAQSLFAKAIQDSMPVVIFKYSGYSADIAAELMEKALVYHNKKKSNKKEVPILPFPENMELNHQHPLWLSPFDDNHLSDCLTANILIESWPDRFNETSVFVLDMFKHNEDDMQDYLTQTLAVAFEGGGALGDVSADNKRLTYAWRSRYKLRFNASRFHAQSDFLMFWFIFFTLLSTLVAVLYTYVQMKGRNVVPNMTQERFDFISSVLLKSNLLLPLVATIIRGIYSILSPLNKYNTLKDAAAQIEAEIYLYRAKVGKYNPRRAQLSSMSDSKSDKTGAIGAPTEEPRILFFRSLDAIYSAAVDGEVRNAALLIPPLTPGIILDDINARIHSNLEEQAAFLTPMVPYDGGNMVAQAAKAAWNTIKKQITKIVRIRKPISRAEMTLRKGASKKNDDELEDSELWYVRAFCCCMAIWNCLEGFYSMYISWVFRLTFCDAGEEEEIAPAELMRQRYDDGLSKLSADDYVRIRMLPLMGEIAATTPDLASKAYFNSITVSLLSVASSALSTFNLSVFIPAALAYSGAIQAWSSYQQTDQKLLQKNIALQRIRQMLVWWDGLTMIEKRVPINKDTLIRTTEQSILNQATTIGSAGGSSAGEQEETGGDEANNEDR